MDKPMKDNSRKTHEKGARPLGSESRTPHCDLERQKILIVDDKKENLVALRQVLRGVGAEIVEATSGNEALAFTLDNDFAVAILDVMMPDMNGYELAEHLRGDDKTQALPIIFLTAILADEQHKFKGYEAGCIDYIVKPYEPEILIGKVKIFLELDSHKQELRRHRDHLELLVKERTANLLHLNGVLRSIRDINQLIVKEKNRNRLIHAACENLTRSRSFLGAWIVLTDGLPDRIGGAQAGFSDAAFARLKDLFRQGDLPACCRRSQIEPGVIVTENIAACKDCPLADTDGENCAVTICLEHEDRRYGFLGIYMPRQFAEDQEDVSLLAELANDITFALHGIQTEAKRITAENELRKANLQLQLALDRQEVAFAQVENLASFPQQNPHPVLRVSLQGKVLETNPTAAPILAAWGCATGEPVPPKWQELIEAVYASGISQHLDLACGSTMFAVTFAPIAGMEYVNLYAHDITQRKQAEESLQHELDVNAALARLAREMITEPGSMESMAKIVLEYAKDLTGSEHGLVSSIDPETGENVCHTFTAMMGKECQIEGEGQRIAFPPDENGKYPGLWGHCLNTRTSFFTNAPSEPPQSKGLPKGHIPLKQYLTVPVLLDQELVGQVALANPGRDFSEHDLRAVESLAVLYGLVAQRERNEEKRRQLEKNLWQAQKMEAAGTLAGGIAHDFNNILAAMIGYVNLTMHEVEEDSRIKHNLEQVLKASLRARNLIKQILAFSRRSEQQVQPLNICPIVKEALKLLRATLPASIEIQQDVPVEIHSILAEPGQIHQIMMNLCTNAAQALREKGGVLKVELTNHIMHKEQLFLKPDLRPGPYIKLSVSDTGEGIDPAIIGRIFEPYFTTKEAQEGTGLGLSVVHGIVKSFGGEVTVYSELGVGTIFNVYLPAITAEPYEEEVQIPLVLGKGERILFVDDEAMLVDVARQTLRRLGYNVKAHAGSEEALEAFQANPTDFDLVMTDFNMPKMNGVQLASEIRKVRPEIPIIVCSGFSERINEANIAEFGIDAFLMKPLYDFELSDAIHKVLEKRRKNE